MKIKTKETYEFEIVEKVEIEECNIICEMLDAPRFEHDNFIEYCAYLFEELTQHNFDSLSQQDRDSFANIILDKKYRQYIPKKLLEEFEEFEN